MHYRPLSIKREGLKKYLNRTSDKHNGFGYQEFLKLLEAKVPVTRLAASFKVNRLTMSKWLDIHKGEEKRAAKKAADEAALDELSDV